MTQGKGLSNTVKHGLLGNNFKRRMMAIQMETYLSGRVGNLVYFTRGGKRLVRVVPAKVRQTAATKSWSNVFGEASAAAKSLRLLLHPVLPVKQDKQMQNAFSGAVARGIKQIKAGNMHPLQPIPGLDQFAFNPATGIRERFKVALSVNRISDSLLAVHIPAFVPKLQIAAPAHTTTIHIHTCAASYSFPRAQAEGSAQYLLQIPYNDQPVAGQTIHLAVPAIQGCLVLTGMRMCYFTGTLQPVMKETFMPSSIIDATFY